MRQQNQTSAGFEKKYKGHHDDREHTAHRSEAHTRGHICYVLTAEL